MNFDFKKLKIPKIKTLILMLAFGIVILMVYKILPDKQNDNDANTQKVQNLSTNCVDNVEERLEKIISKINGISNVHVFITYENNGVKRSLTDSKDSTSASEEKTEANHETTTVMQKDQSGEKPFVYEDTLPNVRGVLIVACGVGDKTINAKITEAVSCVLDVPIHKVRILQGK